MTSVALEPGRVYALRIIKDGRHRSAAAAAQVAAWLRWQEARELRPGTLDAYEKRVALLLRLHPNTPLEDFTEADLVACLTRINPASRRSYITAFNSLFRWAHNRDIIPKNPTRLLGEVKTRKNRYSETFTDAEVEQLIGLPGEDGLRMLLMCDTGLRISELCNLQVRNVQVEQRQLIVLDGKGGRDRIVPLTDRLVSAFSHWALVEDVRPDDYVFGHRKGGSLPGISHRREPLSADALRNWFYDTLGRNLPEDRVWMRKDGKRVRRLRPHATRHTVATTLIRRGAPLAHVAKILGHSSIQTTVQIYGHLVTDDVRSIMELLER